MKKNYLFSMLSVFFLIAGMAAAQTVYYSGNLVKISMLSKSASLSDTLSRWEDRSIQNPQSDYDRSTYYYGHVTLPKHSYLLKQSTEYQYSTWFEGYKGDNYIETEGQNVSRAFSITGAGWDVIPPYFIRTTQVTPLPCGSWLINGSLGNAFIDNNDTLHVFKGIVGQKYSQAMEENLVSIIGRVGDRYLGAFITDESIGWNFDGKYEYRLADLSNSPNIGKFSSPIRFYGLPNSGYSGYPYPYWVKIRQLHNDLYIALGSGVGLSILRFADTSFNYVKSEFNTYETQIELGISESWEYRNGKFYNIEGMDICTYDFNLSDTTFVNRKVIMEAPYRGDRLGIDRDFRYAAQIDGDTLRIFDIDKESYINAISIKGVNKPIRPVVDYPYVYLHQTTFEENSSMVNVEENSSAVKSCSLSAYPNPFNPVTTLEFNIPFTGQLELKIYDALGKEVTTLLSEEKKEGSYKVQFNASSLPSGIYLCRMNAGKYMVTKKIVLLK